MSKTYLQEKLTAGDNITIKDNVISATTSTKNSALFLWPEGTALGTAKTFNMGTSKRIICKLFVSDSIYGPIYVQCPPYYVFDFSGEKATTVFMNNYFDFDWHQVFGTYSNRPTQTYDHRKDDTGVWGWFGLQKPSPSDVSRQIRYRYNADANTITFDINDHNDITYLLEVETV